MQQVIPVGHVQIHPALQANRKRLGITKLMWVATAINAFLLVVLAVLWLIFKIVTPVTHKAASATAEVPTKADAPKVRKNKGKLLVTPEQPVRYEAISEVGRKLDALAPTRSGLGESNGKVIAITDIIKDKKVLDFLCHNQVLERAVNIQRQCGLSAAVVIAQKGVESKWGQSKFCTMTNNFANVKCTRKSCKAANVRLTKKGQVGSTTDHCIQLWDDRASDRFVRLDKMYEGWTSYAKTLSLDRYDGIRSTNDPVREIQALKRGGFATDPNYVSTVSKQLREYNLLTLQKKIDAGYTIVSTNGKYTFYKPK